MSITAADLKRFDTRVLLRALRLSCASDQQLQKINDDRATFGLPPIDAFTSKEKYYEQAYVESRAFGYPDYFPIEITIAQLKNELATRGHVPNKQESIELRKAKQLRNSQKGRRDRR